MVPLKVLAMAAMLWGCCGGGGVPPRTGIWLPKRPLGAETHWRRHQACVKLNVTPTDEWKRAKAALLSGSRKDLNIWLAPGNLAFKAIYWLDIDYPSVTISYISKQTFLARSSGNDIGAGEVMHWFTVNLSQANWSRRAGAHEFEFGEYTGTSRRVLGGLRFRSVRGRWYVDEICALCPNHD